MKKAILLTFLASFVFLTGFANTKPVPEKKQPLKLFFGSMQTTSNGGNAVIVGVTWNTLNSTGHKVSAVSVVDPNGYATYTATRWDQDPSIQLISGALIAYGWRGDFVTPGGGADYVILNGNL